MSKPQQTIAALVREAAKTEAAFFTILTEVLEEDEPERLEEFFARLNIPRSAKADDTLTDNGNLPAGVKISVSDFDQEMRITGGVQKFLDRHMRKLKWHTAHPSPEGLGNCVRLYRAMGAVTQLRIKRVIALLGEYTFLTVEQWGFARELLNRSYREIREATGVVTGVWIDALMATLDPDDVRAALHDFPDMVGQVVESMRELREQVEERRQKLEVRPQGYPPVRPPRYFGGDLMDSGSWRYFWGELSGMWDNLRNIVEQ